MNCEECGARLIREYIKYLDEFQWVCLLCSRRQTMNCEICGTWLDETVEVNKDGQ